VTSRVFLPRKRLISLLLMVFGLLITKELVFSQSARVYAILFFSPTCPHCQEVIQEELPPLIEQYGDQLNILAINVGVPEGLELYQNAMQRYNIPQEKLGVPCLIVGDAVLVGSKEIPEKFPAIIEQGIAAGGISWPDIPGLLEIIPPSDDQPADDKKSNSTEDIISQENDNHSIEKPTISERFSLDLIGNSLAVIVLIAMVGSIFAVGYILITQTTGLKEWPVWIIPVLSLVGIVVAGYLSFVEITQTEAVCGPVGDCNTVQQSPYAVLLGLLPVGIVGIIGYILILIAWFLNQYGPKGWKKYTISAIWIMAFIGVLFSMYLTFLEPFIIGATCTWCITSAIIITIILWAATGEVNIGSNAYRADLTRGG
jgi:uncharacterized membrane protein/glutaredoxin-related protein